MKNPLMDSTHLKEYVIYGAAAALLYCVLLFFHLSSGDYESSYLLYIGNALFGSAIFVYNVKLLKKPYDRQRTAAMLIAGHIATFVGTAFSVIAGAIMMAIYYPDVFSGTSANTGADNAPAYMQMARPTGWLFMVCINAILINPSVGSFLSVLVSYAGKKNQTKDKPAALGKHVSGADRSDRV